jgi:hypothetical protein
MTSILFTTASVITFAAIDRLWGAPKGKTPAKILAGASIATLFMIDWKLAAMGAAIVVGRSIGFADGVATGKDTGRLVLRSAFPVVIALVVGVLDYMKLRTLTDMQTAALMMSATSVWSLLPHFMATILLADWYGKRIEREPWNVQRALDDNTKVELIRGAFAGLGVGIYAMVRGLL